MHFIQGESIFCNSAYSLVHNLLEYIMFAQNVTILTLIFI